MSARFSENAIDVAGRLTEIVRHTWAIGHEAAIVGIFALGVDGGKARRIDQRHDAPALVPEKRIGNDDHAGGCVEDVPGERA